MNSRLLGAALWLAGLGVGGLFLALTAARTDAAALAAALAKLSWPALPGAMAAYALGLLCRAARWRELLLPLRPVTFGRMLRPTLVGQALNSVFPVRLGEVFRANYARTICAVRGSALLGTIAVERLADLALVLGLIAIGLTAIPRSESLPYELVVAGGITLGLAVAGLAVLVALSSRLRTLPLVGARLELFSQGVAALLQARVARVVALTVAIWACEAAALWCLFYGLQVPLPAAGLGLVLGMGALATLLPNAPGFVGTLQFAFLTAATLLGIDGGAGAVVATLAQLFLFLPTVVIGLAWAAWAGESPFRYTRLPGDAPAG